MEWAPSDILTPKSTYINDEVNIGIGEKDVKRVILEKDVERISDADIDPDRIEVWPIFTILSL